MSDTALVHGQASYVEVTRMIERLHRRFLDVIRHLLDDMEVHDINAAQAVLLTNIGEDVLPMRVLIERGHYLSNSIGYNLRKLADAGYLEQDRDLPDRRAARLRLTERGMKLYRCILEREKVYADLLAKEAGAQQRLNEAARLLRTLDRLWDDSVTFGVF